MPTGGTVSETWKYLEQRIFFLNGAELNVNFKLPPFCTLSFVPHHTVIAFDPGKASRDQAWLSPKTATHESVSSVSLTLCSPAVVLSCVYFPHWEKPVTWNRAMGKSPVQWFPYIWGKYYYTLWMEERMDIFHFSLYVVLFETLYFFNYKCEQR